MIQQVNLYRKSGSSDKQLLKNTYILISLAFCGVLLIVSSVTLYKISQQKTRHQQLTQQLQMATSRLADLQAHFPQQTQDNTLIAELQLTQRRYQSLSRIMELLTDDQSDQSLGFSRYLSALANQAERDVWLTRIQFDNTRNDISLQGSTFKPEQIPALLQRLKNSQAFKGRHFARLLIQQNPDNATQTDFSVSSNLKPEEDSKHGQ